ncbi:MAG: MCE family protein [Cyclobacteriaceae bacterium]|nr:MCE family protein [Cyclobacteriaceae bacterium]
MRSKEFKVGLFGVLAIAGLYYGFYFLKGIDFFATTSKYYVVYDNVDNLAVSNPVQVSGFAVGRVSDIRIMPSKNHRVLVEIDIDSKIKLGDSTKAILDSKFLGDKFILLSIGTIRTAKKPGDTLYSELAQGMFDVLKNTAEPVASNLQTTLRKFNVAIDNLSRNSQQLDSIFKKLQKTPDILNNTLLNANEKITIVSGSVSDVATNLNSTLTELKPTLRNFAVLSDSLKRMELNKTISKTQQTLTSLNETLGRLKKGDNTMSKLMTEDTLYVNLNRLLKRMDSLVEHINRYPKHFTAPLGKSHKKVERDLQKMEDEKKKKAAESKKN